MTNYNENSTLIARDVLLGEIGLGVEYYVGDSGVRLSKEPPKEEAVNIWIEPDGDVSNQLITNEELESKGYMTEEQVRDLVNQILNGGA